MSILKPSPSAVALLTNGLRQTQKTLAQNVRISTTRSAVVCAPLSGNNPHVFVSTRQLQSSANKFRSGGYLSDPGNIGKRQDGVNFDTLGSWNNRLDLGINLEQSIETGNLIPKIGINDAKSATTLGRRKQNEDRVSVKEISPDLLLYAIYDGHGGTTAVDYMCKNIPEHIRHWVERGETNLGQVLKTTFNDVQSAFVRHLYQNYIGQDGPVSSGCTATVCLLHRGVQLIVAHVGDSQAVLCRDGQPLALTVPHKPEKAEKERIHEAGGWVTYDSLGNARVNGRLEMSRSLGDAELKSYGVIADPDIRAMQLMHGADAFMVLTTDGIHYVLSEQELVDIVCTCRDPQEAANFLTDQALHYGSEDNCTALIVPFGAWGKYAEKKNLQFSFSRNFQGSRYN